MGDNQITAITNADFTEATAYMASFVAKWAAEGLTFREQANLPMAREPLTRFISEMRDRLGRLEERANG